MDNNKLEYVGFWARLLATFIDAILLLFVTLPLLLIFYGTAYLESDSFVEGPMDFFLTYIFPAIVTVLFWFWKQATPGKMALSAKIVDARSGKEPTGTQYIVRYLAYILSTIPFGLGFLWVAFDSKKQGWHDKLAKTVVVRPQKHTEEVKFEKE